MKELPRENPMCRHSWIYAPDRCAFVCRCGYEITSREIASYQEGDAPVSAGKDPQR